MVVASVSLAILLEKLDNAPDEKLDSVLKVWISESCRVDELFSGWKVLIFVPTGDAESLCNGADSS